MIAETRLLICAQSLLLFMLSQGKKGRDRRYRCGRLGEAIECCRELKSHHEMKQYRLLILYISPIS
jgi:hypothetical protein